ncbi:MAG: stage 0 sporulation protein [Chloroflexi bacterium]|nr:stage 0 sporulation protein [Chloroflexota bacterium]
MPARAVAGLRIRRAPQIVSYDATGFEDLGVNEYVIVDTDKCREAARVIVPPQHATPAGAALRPILRRATAFDLTQWQQLKLRECDALVQCRAQVEKHHLAMRLLTAEYNFDGSHLTFYFVAEGRVDFRSLVKDLAAVFPARVELWQIGPRDRAKLIGGLSPCGREICCERFLGDFPKATVKMAKDQDMPLGPNAATGLCGRPLCCLAYEQPTYQAARGRVPRVGDIVATERGQGRVIARNVLTECVTVQMEDSANATFSIAQVKLVAAARTNAHADAADEED